jgi:hypothetical protein
MSNHIFGFLLNKIKKLHYKLIYLKLNFIFIAGKNIFILNFKIILFIFHRSSSDTTQKSCEPQAILGELITEFNRLCRTINQV